MPRTASIAIAAALLLLAVTTLLPGGGAAQAPARPNVIVLMTDDQTLRDLSVMPRTRAAIGGAGVTFANDYVSYSLCCPSRATFLTGRYSHNTGVLGNRPPRGGFGRLDGARTLPVALQRAGYETAHIGKYLNGYTAAAGVPPGWSDWHGSVDPTTYLMYGYTLNENGTLNTYGEPTVEDPALYQTDVYRRKAVEIIRRSAGSDRPLFLSVAFLAPHAEARAAGGTASIRPAPRHRGALATLPLPRSRAFDEADARDKPAHVRNAPRLRPAQIRRITANFRARREALLSVDEAVEAIVRALAETGQLDRTYVIFTSDNGFFAGEHRIPNGKYLPYEVSTHLPLLIRGPGIAPASRSAELVSNVDLAPTIADVTGVAPLAPFDGRSLMPYARRPARRSTRPILHEGLANAGNGDVDQDETQRLGRLNRLPVANFTGIRTTRWLYVEYASGERELYDLRADPLELTSRHRDARFARTRRALAQQLAQLRRCKGGACTRGRASPPPPARP